LSGAFVFIDYIEIHGIKDDDDDDDEIIEPTNVFADTAKHTDAHTHARMHALHRQ
jgi:hypothetical protein